MTDLKELLGLLEHALQSWELTKATLEASAARLTAYEEKLTDLVSRCPDVGVMEGCTLIMQLRRCRVLCRRRLGLAA